MFLVNICLAPKFLSNSLMLKTSKVKHFCRKNCGLYTHLAGQFSRSFALTPGPQPFPLFINQVVVLKQAFISRQNGVKMIELSGIQLGPCVNTGWGEGSEAGRLLVKQKQKDIFKNTQQKSLTYKVIKNTYMFNALCIN